MEMSEEIKYYFNVEFWEESLIFVDSGVEFCWRSGAFDGWG